MAADVMVKVWYCDLPDNAPLTVCETKTDKEGYYQFTKTDIAGHEFFWYNFWITASSELGDDCGSTCRTTDDLIHGPADPAFQVRDLDLLNGTKCACASGSE